MILQRMGVPIYLQVKNHVLDKIKSGFYRPGEKIPTERELSTELGISRNTVSAAYKELLLEGVLEARQGRGTFVKGATADLEGEGSGSKRERLVKIIDEAMAKVVELGFSVEQFAAIASIRAKEKTEAVKQLRVAVVECAPEYVQRFISQLGQAANVSFEPVLLAELLERRISVTLLEACDLIVTTLEHQHAVASVVGSTNKMVAVAAVPNLDAIIKLARLPVNSEVGVLARTREFAERIDSLARKMAVNQLDFAFLGTEDMEEVRSFIKQHSVLVVSEEREHLARRWATEEQEIITFYYEIDRGSLNQVMLKLVTHVL